MLCHIFYISTVACAACFPLGITTPFLGLFWTFFCSFYVFSFTFCFVVCHCCTLSFYLSSESYSHFPACFIVSLHYFICILSLPSSSHFPASSVVALYYSSVYILSLPFSSSYSYPYSNFPATSIVFLYCFICILSLPSSSHFPTTSIVSLHYFISLYFVVFLLLLFSFSCFFYCFLTLFYLFIFCHYLLRLLLLLLNFEVSHPRCVDQLYNKKIRINYMVRTQLYIST
jgi:hypothetical protein